MLRKCFFMVFILLYGIFILGYTQQRIISPYTYYKQGNYRAAIKEADKLIAKDKENVSAYAVKGWSYLSLSQWKNALKAGLDAYKFTKSDRRIIEVIGEAYYELEEYDKALLYFNKYLRIAPNGQLKAWVYYFVGMIYFKKEKYRKSDIALSTAVYFDDTRLRWILDLAKVQELRGNKEDALSTYKRILVRDKENNEAKNAIKRLNG